MKCLFYQIRFFLICSFSVFLLPNNIFGQENNAESKDEMERGTAVKREIQYEGTEAYESPQFFKRMEKEPRPDWVKALHEARANGDEQLMRELEAQNTTPLEKVGENVGDYSTESSGTVGFPGEPTLVGNQMGSYEDWGTDIHVRSSNTDFRESHPAMATSSDGTIYVVWENFGGTLPYAYLQIYYSTDGGENWDSYGYISNPTYDLSQPSLAIGEGAENYLVLAWVVDDAVPHIEVGYTPLTGYSLTQITPAYLTFWESYQKPVVWTDSYDYSGWYIYLTAEATFDGASSNLNVVFWRSTDYGVSFSDPHEALYGNIDGDEWLDPDGTYGCVGNDLYVAVFNGTNDSLYFISSLDFGASWGTQTAIHPVAPLPVHAVDPDIEAAVNNDNIMLCCTKASSSQDDIAQCYSTDAGVTWSSFYTLEGMTAANEWAAELHANEGGGSWHVTYNDADHLLKYNTRPQDLSAYWQLTAELVNDVPWATAVYTKKAITSNWATDAPGIAWSDYRDGPGDYDIYFDNSSGTTTFSFTINVANGWNMVSVPGLHPVNQNVNTWWSGKDPGADVFKYSGGYTPVTSTTPTEGYWLKNVAPQVYNYTDIQIVDHNPIAGASGWNLIGGYELSVLTSNITTIPPGLQSSPVYRYSSGYQTATTMDPGYGYFVKLAGAGQINIPEVLAKGEEPVDYFKEDWGKIIIIDKAGRNFILYAINGEIDLNKYELPPAPPEGMFDIRYGSGRIAEDLSNSIQSIEMNGIEHPLRVKVENISITLKDETGKEIDVVLEPGEEIIIENNLINKLLVLSGEIVAPIEYALEQNYPNPFNPSTTIKFAVPKESNVNLSIYNVLGELVSTLVNEQMKTGYYEYELNSSSLASGVYLYRIKAGNYVETKKMVLMK